MHLYGPPPHLVAAVFGLPAENSRRCPSGSLLSGILDADFGEPWLLRGCADRDVMRPCGKRARDARSFGELPSFPNDKERIPVPAIPPYIIEPIWEQFTALLPEREVHHPLGCHRSRIPDRVIFEKLVQVLVFGCAYRRIADGSCSATTL